MTKLRDVFKSDIPITLKRKALNICIPPLAYSLQTLTLSYKVKWNA